MCQEEFAAEIMAALRHFPRGCVSFDRIVCVANPFVAGHWFRHLARSSRSLPTGYTNTGRILGNVSDLPFFHGSSIGPFALDRECTYRNRLPAIGL
jgi:hypothetical protein